MRRRWIRLDATLYAELERVSVTGEMNTSECRITNRGVWVPVSRDAWNCIRQLVGHEQRRTANDVIRMVLLAYRG